MIRYIFSLTPLYSQIYTPYCHFSLSGQYPHTSNFMHRSRNTHLHTKNSSDGLQAYRPV